MTMNLFAMRLIRKIGLTIEKIVVLRIILKSHSDFAIASHIVPIVTL